jgi:hypothetical protein
MNINCPKCGFEQPRDRFCANCGIDMENYQAPDRPMAQRLATSSMFYFFLAIIVVIATILFVLKQNEKNQAIGVPEAPEFAGNVGGDETPTPTAEPPVAANDLANGSAWTASQTPNPTVAANVPAQPATATAAATRKRTVLKVTWMEINKDYFVDLFGETLPLGQIRAGILLEEFNGRTLKSRIEQGTKEKMVRTLDSSSHNLTGPVTEKVEVSHRSHDPKVNEKIGVVLDLTRVTVDETGLQFRVEIQRAIPLLQGRTYTVDTMSISDDMLVPSRGAAFISGLFPHREPYDDTEQKLFAANAALKVYNSKSFQASNSEIVVFIEAGQSDKAE